MGNMEALYNTWKAIGVSGGDLSFFQNFFVKFYQAFIEADRWLQYLNGVKTTLLVTALALILGVALGVTVAILRTAHDQRRPGHRNPVLAVLNLVCKIYVTVIRGTPMMVQLLIMGFVIFASGRNFTMIGTLTLGINSGAYVSEIVRGGLMSVDKGQMEAGRSPGPGLRHHHALCHCAPGGEGHPPRPGQRVHRPVEGHLPHHRHRRQGAAVCRPGHLQPDL